MMKAKKAPEKMVNAEDIKRLYPSYNSLQAAYDVICSLSSPNDFTSQEIDGLHYIIPFGIIAIKI